MVRLTLGDFHLPRAEPITGSPRIAAAAGLRHIARPKPRGPSIEATRLRCGLFVPAMHLDEKIRCNVVRYCIFRLMIVMDVNGVVGYPLNQSILHFGL